MAIQLESNFLSKLFDEKSTDSTPIGASNYGLDLLDRLYNHFSSIDGGDAASNFLSYRTVARALRQCRLYHSGEDLSICYDDNCIYAEHAFFYLKRATSLLNEQKNDNR
ncbi:hypothetical protein [Gilvimarinus polysaccharolyticus]|uniref:hypothetical protein n=1 Tax=Gilvimarinus polysaccharolyticus TaxID=863921 RepID=UPI0006738F42|nr:hypothetical protein [Gilvimarinus polysaccharolyticus]